MKQAATKLEKGQSLVLFALLFVVLIAVLAIIFDMANSYYRRRVAQNAADAGALAAARVYCDNPAENYDEAVAACSDFVSRNEAALLPGYPTFSGNTITVGTTITLDTFMARILGQDQVTVKAQAKAGCAAPCLGEGVLPVVWTCKPDAAGSPPGTKACEDLPIDYDTLVRYRDNPSSDPACIPVALKGGGTGYVCPELTIVMDNIDIDVLQCQSSGGLVDCDFNNDGRDDYVSASNRGWADLDGNQDTYACAPTSEGSVELVYWIEKGYECPLEIHTWVGDQSGDVVSLFSAVEERRKTSPIVVLPVFDTSCPNDPTGGAGGCRWDGGAVHPPADVVHTFTSTTNYYHIIRFSAFYITCVQRKNGECPGAEKFYRDNKTLFTGGGDPLKGNDFNAIEGYFLKGYVPGLKGDCGDDIGTGVFTVYLDQ